VDANPSFFFRSTKCPWRQHRLGVKITASRLPRSSVRPHAVRFLLGTDRSRALRHFWSTPDRQGLYIRYAQHALEFSKIPRLSTKYAILVSCDNLATRAQSGSCPILLQHVEAKHVVVCQPCNRRYKSQSALDQHWRASSAHPNCPVCDAGAADTNALAVVRADLHLSVIFRRSSR
jgi:hypothetical protein